MDSKKERGMILVFDLFEKAMVNGGVSFLVPCLKERGRLEGPRWEKAIVTEGSLFGSLAPLFV